MSESQEQKALFKWAGIAEQQFPELKLLHHIPNGGKRDLKTASNLKREGVKAGVPDMCLPVARGKYHGLYIELKTIKGKVHKSQKEWLDALEEEGYAVKVCYGWLEARETIEGYLSLNCLELLR
ncbi:VRR-NUC domain-containing protein [uncultured Clostridium sp.]|uniref:VRR-NUC domain-containing protein n=1 Tax=uncultured Clostridium sp. TaxID=59620 RepID=UPI002613758C|nr:VRR-NUC domain-containing protein [uncultured Clostridium sp.]MCI9110288.1 VRR-NUC domain-containing protein [Bacilli bacterium]